MAIETRMLMKKNAFTRRIDKLGACLSSICAIHCMVMPILIGMLSTVGLGFLADDQAELVIFSAALALALLSAAMGWRAHRRPVVLLAFASAIATTLVGHAMGEDMMLGRFFVIAGAFAIAGCHLLSRFAASRASGCQ